MEGSADSSSAATLPPEPLWISQAPWSWQVPAVTAIFHHSHVSGRMVWVRPILAFKAWFLIVETLEKN